MSANNRRGEPRSDALIVTCPGGLEGVLRDELTAGGYRVTRTAAGAVHVRGGTEEMIRANLELRTASRVLVPVTWGRARSSDALYRLVNNYPWHESIRADKTIAVETVAFDGPLGDARFAALRVKDAIVDEQRHATGRRSSVERRRPDFGIVVHFDRDDVTLSYDSSGRPLHERAYRTEAGEAPLRENLAAGLVHLSGWEGRSALVDPFCGSGTIAIEAAMMRRDRVPGSVGRRYAFERWPWIDRDEVYALRDLLCGPVDKLSSADDDGGQTPIVAADVSPEMVEIAKRNAARAGVEDEIVFVVHDFFEGILPGVNPTPPGTIVTNPPFGARLAGDESGSLTELIQRHLRRDYPGWNANVLTPVEADSEYRGTPAVFNGGIRCRLVGVDDSR